MDVDEYQKLATRAAVDFSKIDLSNEELFLLLRIMIVGGRLGEIADITKRAIFHQDVVDVTWVHSELNILCEFIYRGIDVAEDESLTVIHSLFELLSVVGVLMRYAIAGATGEEWSDVLGDALRCLVLVGGSKGLLLRDVMLKNIEETKGLL